MGRKRSSEEERDHILRKIRRLEKKITDLPDPDAHEPVDKDIEEGEIMSDLENYACVEDEVMSNHVDENSGVEEDNIPLEEEVINILGVGPTPAKKKGLLHKQIAERWTEILEKGLTKEEKELITKDNPNFENISKMVAPKLNKEVAAALNDSAKRRDFIIELRQKQISTTLACVGQALQMCISDSQVQKLTIIKKLNEAGRLLCDSMFIDSKGRRNLVLSSINKDLKDSLLETDTSEYLFGENLTDRIKTAKAVQKSGKELKIQTVERKKSTGKQADTGGKKTNNRALNWRGPPRAGVQQRPQRSTGLQLNRPRITRKNEDRVQRRGHK